jgi:tetratricopeptide (TPR) repeat protein
MQTLTLANIYELQGLKEDALEIYQEILKKDPKNADAKIAIRRLSGMRKKFLGCNEQMKEFFINMEDPIEFNEFERWLLKLWN